MSRPSHGTDQKLLDAARAMIGETGLSGLKLREVAARAGVNLGMFHYHFKTKEEFSRRLLQDIYEDFFGRLSLESSAQGSSLERLRGALLIFGHFSRDHRRLFAGLVTEILRGDKICADFLKDNIPRHVRVVSGLIREGQKSGELRKMPLPVAASFALGGMGAPNLLVTALEKFAATFPQALKKGGFDEDFLSDAAIALRADLILSALSAGAGSRRRQ